MDVLDLQDKLSRGMGAAARKLGRLTVVYRPAGCSQPLGPQRKVISLPAMFEPKGRAFGNNGEVAPVWRGIFDALYTQEADYLVSPSGTFFIGRQVPGDPVECILTNRIVSISRPSLTPQGGYSGFSLAGSRVILSDWPAGVIEPSGSQAPEVTSPGGFGTWTILLPSIPITPNPADVVTDDLGASYALDTAEQTLLGWRLRVRQIGA